MEEKLKEIMASIFEVSPDEITNQTSADDLEKWDSLHHMNLIAAIEEEFGVEFEEEEMLDMINFKLILLTLSEKRSA
jgi:acyl carrier protein